MMRPLGKLIEQLGELGDLAAETAALCSENGIREPENDFTENLTKNIPTVFQLTQQDLKVRKDLRTKRIFTIDPKTAKDLDDALHITPLGGGRYEVGVHIADVSHYVKLHSHLDKIARIRSTSTYLVHKCIPMLPPILSEILCSLNPREDRFAFSVIWTLDREGKLQFNNTKRFPKR